jgi:hypothetical protein
MARAGAVQVRLRVSVWASAVLRALPKVVLEMRGLLAVQQAQAILALAALVTALPVLIH